ncbi:MAG: hypothetical protein ACE5JJ_10580 [Nitrospinota bacterium]
MVDLIDEEERFCVRAGGAVFWCRRLNLEAYEQLRRRALRVKLVRGQPVDQVDEAALALDALDHCILAWEGVRHKGESAPRTRENIAKLPPTVRAEVLEAILTRERLEEEAREEEVKNSSASSPPGSTTRA